MRYLCVILLVLGLLFTACLDYHDENILSPLISPTLSPSPTMEPETIEGDDITDEPIPDETPPREAGSLRLSMRSPITLNPILNEDITVARILNIIFEPLTALDDNMRPISNLAEINFSSDYTNATVTLRHDAIWSDSVPVSSDDFIFTVDFIRNAPENTIYKYSTENISTIEKIDEKTVRVHFVEIFGGSAYLFDFPLIPEHYYHGETNPESARNMRPLGNGMYLYEDYTPFRSITLRSNPYTFHTLPYIDDIEVLFIPDDATEFYAFNQGIIDVLLMEMTEWSRRRSVKETNYGEFTAMYYEFIGFNFNNEVLSNKLFRHALAYAFDADSFVENTYLTHAKRALSPINPSSWLYTSDVRVYDHDIYSAWATIERFRRGETGYDSGQINNPSGESDDGGEIVTPIEIEDLPVFSIITNQENEERIKAARAFADSMIDLDLDISLEILPRDDFFERLHTGDYDIVVGGYYLSVIPDLRFAFSTGGINAGTNLLNYSYPELDRIFANVFSANTEMSYRAAITEMQETFAEELPVISLSFRNLALLTDIRVHGDIKPTAYNIFANINEWDIGPVNLP